MAEIDRAGRRLLAVTEEELQRVVLDIHDGPVQTMFAALGQLTLLRDRLPSARGDGTDPTQVALDQIEALLQSSLREIGTIATTLRSPVFAARPFADIAEELAVQHETLTGAPVTFAAEAIPPLATLVKVALYRVLQEALSNVRRHAHSTSTAIHLSADATHVSLRVEDTGRGFSPPPLIGPDATERSQHIGLRGMRDRAAMVGGEVTVDSEPGAGTRVRVRVPLEGGAPDMP